jgi:hypothetical protein
VETWFTSKTTITDYDPFRRKAREEKCFVSPNFVFPNIINSGAFLTRTDPRLDFFTFGSKLD